MLKTENRSFERVLICLPSVSHTQKFICGFPHTTEKK